MSEPFQATHDPPSDRLSHLSGDGLLDQIDVAVIATDAAGRCVRLNAAAEVLLGYSEAEALGRGMHALLHHKRQDGSPFPEEECEIWTARQERRPIPLHEEVMWAKSNEAVPVECSGSPIRLDNGEPGLVVTLKDLRGVRQAERRYDAFAREQVEMLRQRDATARIERELAEAESIRRRTLAQRVEEAATGQLRSQQELIAAVAEAAPIGIAVLQSDLRIRWCNPAFHFFLHRDQQVRDLANVLILNAMQADEHSDTAKLLRRVRDTGEPFLDNSFAVHRPDGGVSYWWWSVTRLASGEILFVTSEVTEQKKAQDALVQSDKMAAVGRLAASISHEINNPLEAVTNLLYLVDQDGQLSPETREYVKLAESELARVSQIASQTLRFHRQAPGPVTVQARHLIDPVVALYQGRLKHSKIDVRIEVRDVAQVVCHENDIRQILNNLLGNAIDAMPKGGVLRIRGRTARCVRTGRRGLRISVADTGHGMTAQVAAHVFEPFYTTKGASGSGLGLWISHTLAHRHGGLLKVRSRKEEPQNSSVPSGTTFSLFFPDMSENLGQEAPAVSRQDR